MVDHTNDVFEGKIRAKLHEMGFDIVDQHDTGRLCHDQRPAGRHSR